MADDAENDDSWLYGDNANAPTLESSENNAEELKKSNEDEETEKNVEEKEEGEKQVSRRHNLAHFSMYRFIFFLLQATRG